MKHIILTLVAAIITVSAFAHDILTFNNEMTFEVKVVKIRKCEVVFKYDGHYYGVPATDIFSIQFEDPENEIYKDYVALNDNDGNKCFSGRLDADNFHGKRGGHFVLGCLFGPLAMIGTALANPTPERGAKTYYLSKNKDLFNDPEYLYCYRKRAKGVLIGMEALGWAAWILFVLAASTSPA